MREKDLADGLFFEKWPDWIRWLLFLPAAVVVPILFFAIQKVTGGLILGSTDGIGWELYGDAVIGAGAIVVGAHVAPKNQFLVAIILLVIVSVTGVFSIIGGLASQETTALLVWLNGLIVISAGVFAVYSIHQAEIGEIQSFQPLDKDLDSPL